MASHYVSVASRERWTLAYPCALWEALDAGERAQVVQRQERLLDAMQNAQGCAPEVRQKRAQTAPNLP